MTHQRIQLQRTFQAAIALTVVLLIGSAVQAGAIEYDGQVAADGTRNPSPLVTADGVNIVLSYYPGSEGAKSVPVILLHDEKGSRADFRQLATALQGMGCAVIVPDLRGHGDSTKRSNSNLPILAARLSPNDYTAMALQDMDAIRKLLWEKNNEKQLNAEATCLLGAGLGASVAVCWTSLDWARAPIGTIRQGQDVKALVLISPGWSIRGLPVAQVMNAPAPRFALTDQNLQRVMKKRKVGGNPNPVSPQLGAFIDHDFRREAAILMLVGKNNSRTLKDAERLNTMFEKYQKDAVEEGNQKGLFFGAFDTSLQGTKMLGRPELGIETFIGRFIDKKLVKAGYGWNVRKLNPYGE